MCTYNYEIKQFTNLPIITQSKDDTQNKMSARKKTLLFLNLRFYNFFFYHRQGIPILMLNKHSHTFARAFKHRAKNKLKLKIQRGQLIQSYTYSCRVDVFLVLSAQIESICVCADSLNTIYLLHSK